MKFKAPKAKVLVVGATPSFTWAAVRCLNDIGIRPHLMQHTHLSAFRLPFFSSKFSTYQPEAYQPDPDDVLGALDDSFAAYVAEYCKKHQIDVLVPADFPIALALKANESMLEKTKLFRFSDTSITRDLNDKWQFSCMLRWMDIEQPKTELIKEKSEAGKVTLDPPFIVKPLNNANGAGFRKFDHKDELLEYMKEDLLFNRPPLLAQEFIDGPEYCGCLYAVDGKIKAEAIFANRKPDRIFIKEPKISEVLQKVLAHTGYTGLALMDVMEDKEKGVYKPLEMNPRIWGSILATPSVGVNFIGIGVLDVLGEPLPDLITPDKYGTVMQIPLFDRVFARLCKKKYDY